MNIFGRSMILFVLFACAGVVEAAAPVSFAGQSICMPDRITKPAALLPYLGLNYSNYPLEFEADLIQSPQQGVLTLKGDASVVQGAQAVYANQLIFSRQDSSVRAAGNVVIHFSEGDRITADFIELDLDTRIGRAANVNFQTSNNEFTFEECSDTTCIAENNQSSTGLLGVPVHLRGRADHVYFDSYERARFEEVELSRCVEGDNSVVLVASEIVLDRGLGEATGRNLFVRFFDVPVFYFPTITFPIGDNRKTGFLFPTVAFGGGHGSRVVIPYYWSIAPSHDATVTPDYMATRGTLIRSEYRYIGNSEFGKYGGRISAEIIPEDRIYGDSRYGWSLDHNQGFSENWRGSLKLGYVSDSNYLDSFGDTLGIGNADYVPQSGRLEYQRANQFLQEDAVNFSILVSNFQNIDPAGNVEDEPYSREPEIIFDWRAGNRANFIEPSLNVAWTRFEHPGISRSAGNRFNVRPSVALNILSENGFVRPQLDVDVISYNLKRKSTEEAWDSSAIVPVFSIDSGIELKRNLNWSRQAWSQITEPRLFYSLVPYVDQNDQPIFDDEEFELNSTSKYFVPNRFYRKDRIGDTNRVSIGLESRIIESSSGKDKIRIGLAQMFYLTDRKVRGNRNLRPLTNKYSDLFGEMTINLTDELDFSVDSVWSWADSEIASLDLGFIYNDYRSSFSISYEYGRHRPTEEVALDWLWPIADKWMLSFENIYSLDAAENIETGISLGYDSCCWAAQVELTQDPGNANAILGNGTEIVFRLQLKDLGGISSDTVKGIVTGLGID